MFRYLCLALGMVGIVLTALSVKTVFWKSSSFTDSVTNIQMEGNYLPYRIRKIFWAKEVAVLKVELERVMDNLWADKWVGTFGLFLIYPVILGINRKYWPEVLVALIIFSLGVMNENPNSSYFSFWILFPMLPIMVSGIKKAKRNYLLMSLAVTIIFWAVK